MMFYMINNLLQILFGFFGTLAVLWFSRHREYAADAGSAEVLGKDKMIAALDKGARNADGLKRLSTETRDLFRRPLEPDEFKGVDAVVIDPPRATEERGQATSVLEEERVCAAIMDAALLRLANEGRLDVAAALLSGDQRTFETFRCEAPELVHLPAATFAWYEKNYLDRDYPIRLIMRLNGVKFPE